MEQVRASVGTPIVADFASAICSPLVQDSTTGIWYAYANGTVYPIMIGWMLGGSVSVSDINSAITAVSAAGGGRVVLPAGTITIASRIILKSGVTLMGAGMEATKIVNTSGSSPDNIAIDGRGVLGSNYAINVPTEGALTVTTTTAANAGNFATGSLIALSGDLYGQDYVPLWITTVASVNAGTGVITLNEKLRRADLSKVHVVTSQVTNIGVQDLTISSTGDVGIIFKYVRNGVIERVYLGSGIGTAGGNIVGSRDVRVSNCIMDAGKSIDFHSTLDSVRERNVLRTGGLALEGGCDSISLVAEHIYDPAGSGMKLDTQTQRCKISACSIINVADNQVGINIDGSAIVASGVAGYGSHVVEGNIVTGNGSGTNYGMSFGGSSKGNLAGGNHLHNLGLGITIPVGSTVAMGANFYTNCVTDFATSNSCLADTLVGHIRSGAGTPTIVVGTGAGAGTVGISGTDVTGTITVLTGAAPAASAKVAAVTFRTAYTAAPEVLINPTDANTAALSGTGAVFVKRANTSTTGFELWVGAAALAQPIQYNFSYHVMQAS
jgi:hypothetical protein